MSEQTDAAVEPALPRWAVVGGLLLLTASGLLSAVLELLFIPLYAGTVIVPVAGLGAIVGNVLLPRLAAGLGVAPRVAAIPFLAWLLVVLAVALVPRPEGDVLVPGGSLTWVTYGVLLGGTAAGTITLVVLSSAATAGASASPRGRTPNARR